MNRGVLSFNWTTNDGVGVDNWWSSDLARDPKRFVYNQWGQFAVAVDLKRQEAQIKFEKPPSSTTIRFRDLKKSIDESTFLAFEAVCDTEHAAFAAELLLRVINRDDLADMISR